MDLTESQRASLIDSVLPWMSYPEVRSIAIREKTRSGEGTGQTAVVVGVVRKLPKEQLGPDSLIPESVPLYGPDGSVHAVPTDVVEEGTIRALADRERPCPGGLQIAARPPQSLDWSVGTLGVGMLWNHEYVLLTNAHVVSLDGGAPAGSVYQPESGDDNLVSSHVSCLTITTYPDIDHKDPLYNVYDVAWCSTDTEKVAQLSIKDIELNGTRGSAAKGDKVAWRGAATNRKATGSVEVVDALVKVELGTQYAWFKDVIKIVSADGARSGDSGSCLVCDGTLVGLVFSGSDTSVYACPLPPSSMGPQSSAPS